MDLVYFLFPYLVYPSIKDRFIAQGELSSAINTTIYYVIEMSYTATCLGH